MLFSATLLAMQVYEHTSGGGAKAMDWVVLYVPRWRSFSKAVGFLVSLASLKVASLLASASLSYTCSMPKVVLTEQLTYASGQANTLACAFSTQSMFTGLLQQQGISC